MAIRYECSRLPQTPTGIRPRPQSLEQVSRRRGHRAERHLGSEAALTDDGAWQHRGRDVDHRCGVADPGAECLGSLGDSQSGGRRFFHRAAVRHRAQRRRVAQGAVEPAHHAARCRRHQAAQPARVCRHAPVGRQREADVPLCVDRRHRHHGCDAGVHQFFELRCRAWAADEPD